MPTTYGEGVRIGIVGCGLIGQRRARTAGAARIVACTDPDAARAREVKEAHPDIHLCESWQQVVTHRDVDVVVVATPHDTLAMVTAAAIAAGKHILVEKPAGRTSQETRALIEAAHARGVLVRVGLNHRYHRALRKARQLVDDGTLGPLYFIRGRYGHGGRIGYETEWRANKEIAGGGELIDQGIHLIDLARWFLGEFETVQGSAHTYFWNMPVEDNGFILARTAQQQVAFLHASCTEWKNLFSFEICGQMGKLEVTGLGGSYGVEKLTHYRMLPQMGPPETTMWEYPQADDSWNVEFAEFCEDIRLNRQPAAGLADAVAALSVVERIYQQTPGGLHAGPAPVRGETRWARRGVSLDPGTIAGHQCRLRSLFSGAIAGRVGGLRERDRRLAQPVGPRTVERLGGAEGVARPSPEASS
jgi:predicted dehydrogenase